MLPFIIVLLSLLKISFASETSLEALQQKAQKEALQYRNMIQEINENSQKKLKQYEKKQDQCQAFGSCFKKDLIVKGANDTSKHSPLLNDKAPIIFVSSSMPIQALKTLAYQAKQQKAKLVIRGMVKGTMRETADLAQVIDHPLDIDPKLFETYGIQKVPVFFIFHQDRWHKIEGNVDLFYALEKALGGEKH